jgi:hypothetical protein
MRHWVEWHCESPCKEIIKAQAAELVASLSSQNILQMFWQKSLNANKIKI